jgi:hypothetical protein
MSAPLDPYTAGALNAGWITREDASLKVLLSGILVSTATAQKNIDASTNDRNVTLNDGLPTSQPTRRRVPVHFRFPDGEAAKQVYPMITIDYLTTRFDAERAHMGTWIYGNTNVEGYHPAGAPAGLSKNNLPVPMTITYQITTHTRSNQHDREINVELMTRRIPARYGGIDMVGDAQMGVPDDNSTRRLDLLSGPINGDTRDEQQKRLFRKIYTVGISSEMFQHEFKPLNTVGHVLIDVVSNS